MMKIKKDLELPEKDGLESPKADKEGVDLYDLVLQDGTGI